MELGLRGKKVLVTGATKGIGRAIAEAFLAEGAAVAICARNTDEVASAVGELSKTGINNFNIDLMALVHGVEAATSALADGRGGAVISIGTTATAEHFGPGAGSYSALKSAVTNWTLGQAQVLGARGIRCNVVSPGPIMVPGGDWDMIKNAMPPFYEATCSAHPGGRIGEASDVANAVVFLASSAAKHINGTNVTVDGGFLKRVDF